MAEYERKMNMAQDQPLVEEWRAFFSLAGKIKEIAPWNLMDETDVFGVRNPETGEPGFVSIMGMEGMHFCIVFMEIPPPDPEPIPITVNKGDLQVLRNVPQGDMVFML